RASPAPGVVPGKRIFTKLTHGLFSLSGGTTTRGDRNMRPTARIASRLSLAGAAAFAAVIAAASTGTPNSEANGNNTADALKTESPIKHVIILIGENRGTDHTFGVYKPKGRRQTIANILSKGIVKEDGSPGPNFGKALQFEVSHQAL